jgi:hypothetical protein
VGPAFIDVGNRWSILQANQYTRVKTPAGGEEMKNRDIGDPVWEGEGGAPINTKTGDDGEGPDHHRLPGGGIDGSQRARGDGDEGQRACGSKDES